MNPLRRALVLVALSVVAIVGAAPAGAAPRVSARGDASEPVEAADPPADLETRNWFCGVGLDPLDFGCTAFLAGCWAQPEAIPVPVVGWSMWACINRFTGSTVDVPLP